MSRRKKQRPKSRPAPQRQAARPPAPAPPAAPAVEIAPGFWRRHWLPALILLLLPLLLYGRTATFGFVLDDKLVISENTFVTEGLAGLGDILGKDSFQGYFGEQRDVVAGGRYRPLSLVTFAIEHQLYGLAPGRSHVVNIILYGLTAVLLLRVLALLVPPPKTRPWFLTVPFIAALLWVLHPIHSEVVANIKGRDEILSLLLSLATLHLTWRALAGRAVVWLPLACVVFFLALLAKENAITFLAVVPLAAFIFSRARLGRIVVIITPLVVTTIIWLVLRTRVLGFLLDPGIDSPTLMNDPFVEATTAERYATVFYTLVLYLKLLVFPHPLTHDYYPYHIPLIGWNDLRACGALMFYLMLVAGALALLPRRHIAAFCVLLFVATLSIVSNVVIGVGTFMNERFVYMPSIGFCLLVAWLLVDLGPSLFGERRRLGRAIGLAVVGLAAVGFALKTVTRVPAWRTPLTLNEAAIAVSTDSARVNCFYAIALYSEAETVEDPQERLAMYELANTHLIRASEIYDGYPSAMLMRAGTVTKIYGIDRDLPALLDRLLAILAVRHVPYVDEYVAFLDRRRPDVPALLEFHHRAGFDLFFQRMGRHDLAIRYLTNGLALDENDAQLLFDLTRVHVARGEYAQAREYAERGLRQEYLRPQFTEYVELIAERTGS